MRKTGISHSSVARIANKNLQLSVFRRCEVTVVVNMISQEIMNGATDHLLKRQMLLFVLMVGTLCITFVNSVMSCLLQTVFLLWFALKLSLVLMF